MIINGLKYKKKKEKYEDNNLGDFVKIYPNNDSKYKICYQTALDEWEMQNGYLNTSSRLVEEDEEEKQSILNNPQTGTDSGSSQMRKSRKARIINQNTEICDDKIQENIIGKHKRRNKQCRNLKVKENDEAIINKCNGGKESFSQSILPNLESTQKYKHNDFNSKENIKGSLSNSQRKEAALSLRKIKGVITRQNFYGNSLQRGGEKLTYSGNELLYRNKNKTIKNEDCDFTKTNEHFHDKLNSIIPLINQSEKFIENSKSDIKARKTLRVFQCGNSMNSPRIKVDDDCQNYSKPNYNQYSIPVSPEGESQDHYSARKDRQFFREFSYNEEKIDFK